MSLELLDWRRRVAALYADVRGTAEHAPDETLARFRAGRDHLFRDHPESPLGPARRAVFTQLPHWPLDSSLRFDVPVESMPPRPVLATSLSGEAFKLVRIGQVHLPLGDLEVYWIDVCGDRHRAAVASHMGAARPGCPWRCLAGRADDGTVVHVDARDGEEPSLTRGRFAPLRPSEPPEVFEFGGGQLGIGSALDAARVFEDPLPGTRVVEAPSGTLVAPTAPTDRYPHGVLGDDLEAGALSVLDAAGRSTIIALADDEVIEGLSAIVADLDDDDVPELVVTVSTAETGARLAVYELDGSEVARSEAIGQGFRWLHQIAVGPTGPGGEAELTVVRTPHIGGVVEAYRLGGDRPERVASRSGYSSHRLGSANLDMALLADADGDGRLDVVVPDQAMSSLRVLTRVDDGFSPRGSLELEGSLATNVAATPDTDGRLVLAAGTTDGRLLVFR